MTKYSILIVEDEYIPANYMQKILEHNGHRVVGVADSSDAALSYLNKHHIDLVLMDIKIRGNVDGIEVAKSFQPYENIAILYISAYTDDDFLQRAKDTNTIGYLVKPIQENTLLSTIEIAMAKFIEQLPPNDSIELCDDIIFNRKRQTLLYNNKGIALSIDETIIVGLVSNDSDVLISYKELEEILWKSDLHSDNALRTIIWRLRKKLPDCIEIENIYNYGYKLKCN